MSKRKHYDTVTALRPGWKQVYWEIGIEVPDGIICASFPGPLSQIVRNPDPRSPNHNTTLKGEHRWNMNGIWVRA
jgi:hypothetical protein